MAKRKPQSSRSVATLAKTAEGVKRSILLVRGESVLLDEHLADLYGVETRALLQAVKRNEDRFPEDFRFQLTQDEWAALRSQSVITKPAGRGGRRYAPYVFTEHGVAMLASVLRSEEAVAVNIEIIRAFVELRRLVSDNAQLARRMDVLEQKHDEGFRKVSAVLKELLAPTDPAKSQIGYHTEATKSKPRKARRAKR